MPYNDWHRQQQGKQHKLSTMLASDWAEWISFMLPRAKPGHGDEAGSDTDIGTDS